MDNGGPKVEGVIKPEYHSVSFAVRQEESKWHILTSENLNLQPALPS